MICRKVGLCSFVIALALILTSTGLLMNAARAQETQPMEEAGALLERFVEIDTVLNSSRSSSEERENAMRELSQLYGRFNSLKQRENNPDNLGLMNTWQRQIGNTFNQRREAYPSLPPLDVPQVTGVDSTGTQPVAPETNSDQAGDEKRVTFTPNPLPEFDGSDEAPHKMLVDRIGGLQSRLQDLVENRPPQQTRFAEELVQWDGQYNEALRGLIFAEQQLIYNRGGIFSQEETASLQNAYNTFDRIKDLLKEAGATDEQASALRQSMVEIERSFNAQQQQIAAGQTVTNMSKTDWLGTALLKMLYNGISAQVAELDGEYSQIINQIIALSGPAETGLDQVLEARMQRGLAAVNDALPEDAGPFDFHMPRGGVMRGENQAMFDAFYYERMNHPLHEGEKSADIYKGRIDAVLVEVGSGQMSDEKAVKTLREIRDDMTRQKPYRNKRDDLIKQIDKTNKEIDKILYKKKAN